MNPGDFIELYDNVLDADFCATLRDRFEASGLARRGATGGGVDLSVKDSWDIRLEDGGEWASARLALEAAVRTGLTHYLRKYAHVVLAPLRMKYEDAETGDWQPLSEEITARLDDGMLHGLIERIFRPGKINLQKYVAGRGGYPYWHSEIYPEAADGDALHRVLFWTLYLNDDFESGETEFRYQGRRIKPKTGTLLIAPAGFTHTHRGNTPHVGDKYIATSWVLYRNAAELFI